MMTPQTHSIGLWRRQTAEIDCSLIPTHKKSLITHARMYEGRKILGMKVLKTTGNRVELSSDVVSSGVEDPSSAYSGCCCT